MRRRFFCLIFWGLILGATVPLPARTFSFPEQNFQCEIPDSWTIVKATGAAVVARSPTGEQSFRIMTSMLTEGLTIDSSGFMQSIRGLFTQAGYEVDGPSYVVLQGQRFSYWKLVPPDPNPFGKRPAWAWTIIANGRLYTLEPTCDTEPGSNAEIMGILNSFQFISPPLIPVGDEAAEDLGGSPLGNQEHRTLSPMFITGLLFYLAVVPAIAICILIVFIKRQERRRNLTQGR